MRFTLSGFLFTLMAGGSLALAGCSADGNRSGATCTTTTDCGAGMRCVDGRCVRATDGSASTGDSGGGGGADSGGGPGTDSGGADFDAGGAGDMDAGGGGTDAGIPLTNDEDGDGITDLHEGRFIAGAPVDTDGDGTADYLDDDSDGDGILDSVEAGDASPASPPIDSDFDGTPDFRDLDSDGNGVTDMIEGAADVDGDGRADYRDIDNDGDGIDDLSQIGTDPATPPDADGDGIPDYDEVDSDGDTIGDGTEGLIDTDADLSPDMRDLDTDGDGITDAVEAGDADLATPPVDTDTDGIFDFRDPDSDADGLSDAYEHTHGTSPILADTDGDGVSDLIEVGAGTDPLDGTVSPRTRGDFVFLVPYMAPPSPTRDTLQFATTLQKADVYFLMDNTGSMGGTITNLQAGLTTTVIPNIRATIPIAWFGVGGFDDYPLGTHGWPGYRVDTLGISHDQAFFQYQIMTGTDALAQTAVNRYGTNNGYDGAESGVAALYALAARDTLSGYARFPGLTPPVCPAGYRASACFRPDAVPIIVIMTDVDQHNSPTCPYGGGGECDYAAGPGSPPGGGPSYASTIAALAAINARVVGINTSGAGPFLNRLVQDTTIARGAPGVSGDYVLSAPGGAGLGPAVTTAVQRAAQVPLEVSAQAADVVDPGETVDAVAAFLDHLETNTVGAPGRTCTLGLSHYDRPGIDTDAFDDTFRAVAPGTPVCFDIIPKTNVTVMATLDPQVFRARINVIGDGFTPLDNRYIFFLVPPRIPDPNE